MKGAVIFLYIIILVSVLTIVRVLSLRRKKRLSAYAQSKGWSFSPLKNKKMDALYPQFKCLRRGHSRYACNIMQGTQKKIAITAFDYHYVTGHGKSRKVHHFSALVISNPMHLKPLFLRPEHAFDKVSDFFGHNDIDFESAEFSQKFYVKAGEKRWAYDVIHPRMMEYLMASPKFHIQFASRHTMLWRRKRLNEQDFDDAVDLILGMLDRLPEYVKKQQTEPGERLTAKPKEL